MMLKISIVKNTNRDGRSKTCKQLARDQKHWIQVKKSKAFAISILIAFMIVAVKFRIIIFILQLISLEFHLWLVSIPFLCLTCFTYVLF